MSVVEKNVETLYECMNSFRKEMVKNRNIVENVDMSLKKVDEYNGRNRHLYKRINALNFAIHAINSHPEA